MQTSTRGIPAAPTVNGDSPLNRAQAEMFTMKESLSQRPALSLPPPAPPDQAHLGKINAGHRLIDLQRPRLACLGIDVVPVVKTKRHIAVFLHFENHELAQRVNGPSRYEDAVTRLWREARQMVRHRPVRDRLPQIFRSGARLQARIDAAFGPCLQHDPCFGFAGLARRQISVCASEGCTWTESLVARIEKLQQQRESAKAPRPVFPASAPADCSSN